MPPISSFSSSLEVSFALSAIAAYVNNSYIYNRKLHKEKLTEIKTNWGEEIEKIQATQFYQEAKNPFVFGKQVSFFLTLSFYVIYINTFISITMLLFSGFYPEFVFSIIFTYLIFPYLLYFPIIFLVSYKLFVERNCNNAMKKIDYVQNHIEESLQSRVQLAMKKRPPRHV